MSKMKIKLKEASSFIKIPVGDVIAEVEYYQSPDKPTLVWLGLIVPGLEGSYNRRQTPIDASDDISTEIKRLYRHIVGTALFNANEREIMYDKFDMANLYQWEDSIESDRAGIKKVVSFIQGLLDLGTGSV